MFEPHSDTTEHSEDETYSSNFEVDGREISEGECSQVVDFLQGNTTAFDDDDGDTEQGE